jgi:hypothetical protein
MKVLLIFLFKHSHLLIFFFKILNKNCFYCSYLSGNLKTYDFNGIYNLLVRKIIEEKYGIFKISTSKHQSFYFLKKNY